jgi:glutathione S-transferase
MSHAVDQLHYLRIPEAHGGRAEKVRMCYVLAGKPYADVFHTFVEARTAVVGKNPYKQYPFVETPGGETIYQTIAIMHHAAHGTPAWPSDPVQLTRALAVAMGAYDLYQAFGGFAADDLAAKAKFEERKAPQLLAGLGEIYGERAFAAGETPSFADCLAHEAVAWVVRRNDVCRNLFEADAGLVAFQKRFEALPAIAAFMQRQAAARAVDNAV